MSASEAHKVLQRKVRVGRNGYEARVMTPARAVRLALARAGEELFDLPLVISGVQVSTVNQDTVVEQFKDDWLIMVLDGPDGAMGATAVNMPFVGAFVESQTLGRVLPHRGPARSPTQTDAALIAPLLDSTLAGMGEILAGQEGEIRVDGLCFGARIESARMLGLLLEASEFHLFRLDIGLGDGAAQGEMILAIPMATQAMAMEEDTSVNQKDGGPGDGNKAHEGLEHGAFMGARIRLDAVLWQIGMPLSQLEQLSVGDLLEIPQSALSNTQLCVRGAQIGGNFCLGQINGFRAVRLLAAESEHGATGESTHRQTQALVEQIGTDAPPPGQAAGSGSQPMRLVDVHANEGPPSNPHDASTDHENLLPDLPDLSDLPELS